MFTYLRYERASRPLAGCLELNTHGGKGEKLQQIIDGDRVPGLLVRMDSLCPSPLLYNNQQALPRWWVESGHRQPQPRPFCITGHSEGAHMAPDSCLDWALLLLTGRTGLASEVYVVSLLQFHHAPRGRTLIIREDLKGIQD